MVTARCPVPPCPARACAVHRTLETARHDDEAAGAVNHEVMRRFGLTGASCMVVCRPAARAFRRTASVRTQDSSVLVRRGSIWLGLGLG